MSSARHRPRPFPDAVPREPRRSEAKERPVMDERLRPFVTALADLLLADLLRYPPEK
jgi:hypothetical protein